jgi:hypothetical protein
MTAVRQVVAGLSGIALAGGIALGASVALASSAHATCADLGGTFGGGVCTVVTGGTTTTVPIAGPSGRVNETNPWTQTTTTPSTTDLYHGNGPGSLISSTTTPGSTTTANPGGHEVSGVPGGGP